MTATIKTYSYGRGRRINNVLVLGSLQGASRIGSEANWRVLTYLAENMDPANTIVVDSEEVARETELNSREVLQAMHSLHESTFIHIVESDQQDQHPVLHATVVVRPDFITTIAVLSEDQAETPFAKWDTECAKACKDLPIDDRFLKISESINILKTLTHQQYRASLEIARNLARGLDTCRQYHTDTTQTGGPTSG